MVGSIPTLATNLISISDVRPPMCSTPFLSDWSIVMIEPKPRTKHRVTIEFDIEMAPEFADKIKNSIGSGMHGLLGYPMEVLGQSLYSFDKPNPPEQVSVKVVPVA